MFIVSVVTDEMIVVPVAWAFLTHRNKYIYEHGVFEPIRKKLEELQGHYIVKPVDDDDDDDDEEDGVTTPGMVLSPLSSSVQKIVVCDFEKAVVIAVK